MSENKPPVVLVRLCANGVHSIAAPYGDSPYMQIQKAAFLERIAPALRDFDAAIKRAQAAKPFAK